MTTSVYSRSVASPASAQQSAASSISSPSVSVSPPTASAGIGTSAWQAYHWNKGVEKARKSLSETDISTMNSLLCDAKSVDGVVEELQVQMTSRGIDRNQSNSAHRLQKFLRSLDKYGKVVDVCVQHSPEVTSLVWGSVRLVIDVGLNYLDTQEALCNSAELILTKTSVCEYYATMLTELTSRCEKSPLGTLQGLVKEVDDALSTLYTRVLVFTIKVHQHFTSRKGWVSLFLGLGLCQLIFAQIAPGIHLLHTLTLFSRSLTQSASKKTLSRDTPTCPL